MSNTPTNCKQFPFGHGLSYTSFEYAPACTATRNDATGVVTVTLDITNTGGTAGSEVAQLYAEMPVGLGEPLRQLKAFSKLALGAGETAAVSFELNTRDLSIWDEALHAWTQGGVLGQSIAMRIGGSSRDLRSECALLL